MNHPNLTIKRGMRLCMALLIAGLLVLSSWPSQARAGALKQASSGNEYSFSSLGFDEETLYAPYDGATIRFGLPADWVLIAGTEIQLDFTAFFEYTDLSPLADSAPAFGGLLSVRFNNELLTTILLDQAGQRTVSIPVPDEALDPSLSDNRHELELTFTSEESCHFDIESLVVIHPTSRFILPHQSVAISTDLASLPLPIFQRDSVIPDQATFVVPDQPSSDELQSALAVAAGFGRMTNGDMQYSFSTVSQLSADQLTSTHLIMIGQAAKFPFPLLSEIQLPLPPNESGFDIQEGVIQMAVSPWNQSKAVLLVSGNSDEAVLKAGQALSTGNVIGGLAPNLALITEVNPEAGLSFVPTNRSLAELGYESISITRVGSVEREFEFYLPPNMIPEGTPFVNLVYAHSTLLDYDQSGVTISINNRPIGSARFDDESALNGSLQVSIPIEALHSGINRLSIETDLQPRDYCATYQLEHLWFTIDSATQLNIPLSPLGEGLQTRILDLSLYPELVTLSPSSGSLAFVLPPSDPIAWEVATQIAFDLGDSTNWIIAEHEVAFVDALPEDLLGSHDLLFIGLPTTLPTISQLGTALPAPFEAGSNFADLSNFQVVYRFNSDTSLGYIELLESPWAAGRAVLAVLGSTPQGLRSAGDAIATPSLRGGLAGDLALVNGEQIVSTDTRLNQATTGGTSSDTGISVTPGVSAETTSTLPGWLPLALGVVLLFIVVVAILAFVSRRRRS